MSPKTTIAVFVLICTLLIIAILSTPFQAPSFPASIVDTAKTESTLNLAEDFNFTLAPETKWNLSTNTYTLGSTSSGSRLIQTIDKLELSQSIAYTSTIGAIRIGTEILSDKGEVSIGIYSPTQGVLYETILPKDGILLSPPLPLPKEGRSFSIKITLPARSSSELRTIKIHPLAIL